MNLIITCPRHMEDEAVDEIQNILYDIGDESPDITITNMSGILVATTRLDPVSVPNKMRKILKDEPWTIRYCMRVIPIHATVDANIDAIAEAAIKEATRYNIPSNSTYKISVEKRNTDISSSAIIESIARNIKNRVSLDHADITILVEILGKIAGISILRDTDIFSAEKIRRGMNDHM